MPRKRPKPTAAPRKDEDNKPDVNYADLEVGRRVAAIKAIQDVEIEHVLTELRILRSCLNDYQLDAVALHFVRVILPNATAREEDGLFVLNLGGKDEVTSRDDADERILASMRFRPNLAAIPSFGGHEFQSRAGRAGVLRYENLQMSEFVLDEEMESQMLGQLESLQPPGFASQRLSIGTTPKTLRLPKPGEMLLSVRGSPLDIYKDENMESIDAKITRPNEVKAKKESAVGPPNRNEIIVVDQHESDRRFCVDSNSNR